MTHDLIRDLLEELGATVECIVITELRDRTFFAEIRLLVGRPAPHRVGPAVRRRRPGRPGGDDHLRRGGAPRRRGRRPADEDDEPPEADELVSEFREFIEGIRPEDFES